MSLRTLAGLAYRRLRASLPAQIVSYGWDGRFDHKGFPQIVHIENTNLCPARCSMCAMDKMTRKTGIMDYDLFRKIVDECALYARHVREVHLHGFGEPLLDKLLPEKIRYAKDRCPKAFTYIVTTANTMTETMARELILAGLDGMKVSLYGDTPETYESIHRRLKFEKTVAAVDMFLRVRDELKAPKPQVRLQFATGVVPAEELLPWARRWGPKLDAKRGDLLLDSTLHNWVGARQGGESRVPEARRWCDWPFSNIQILWDGCVCPCCFDYDGTVHLGDVTRSTIRDVWVHGDYEGFRAAWRSRHSHSIPLCKACDAPDGVWSAVRLPAELQPGPHDAANVGVLETACR